MKVKCEVCGLTWIFPMRFTSVEEFTLTEHMAEHPGVKAEYAVRTFLGNICEQTDIEILEGQFKLEDPREE